MMYYQRCGIPTAGDEIPLLPMEFATNAAIGEIQFPTFPGVRTSEGI